jgi:hypothetical protein
MSIDAICDGTVKLLWKRENLLAEDSAGEPNLAVMGTHEAAA